MSKYKKKPLVIDAFKIGIDYMPDWFIDSVVDGVVTLRTDMPENCHMECRNDFKTWCEINTLEGVMVGNYGDYIIKGVQGEIYPCKAEIFEETYEAVNHL